MKQYKGDYEIAASFCTPKKASGKEKTVILATHGIGPGRSHWNSPFKPDEYNFVQHALEIGYSVFFYDRLGCGASSRSVLSSHTNM
jgi:pimeloyl-ACP methyl ester carboxylesterase